MVDTLHYVPVEGLVPEEANYTKYELSQILQAVKEASYVAKKVKYVVH